MHSYLDVERETDGEELVLLGGNDSLEGDASNESGCDLIVDLVSEHCVEVAILVHLELSCGVSVESVGNTELGLDALGDPVEGELAANSLAGVGRMVHVEEELSELESLLVGGLVLEANVGLVSEDPVKAEVVLLEVGGVGVKVELATEGEVLAHTVGPGQVSKVGPCVYEELGSNLLGDVLKATLEVGVSRGTSGLCVNSADELESLGDVEFLQLFQTIAIPLPQRCT